MNCGVRAGSGGWPAGSWHCVNRLLWWPLRCAGFAHQHLSLPRVGSVSLLRTPRRVDTPVLLHAKLLDAQGPVCVGSAVVMALCNTLRRILAAPVVCLCPTITGQQQKTVPAVASVPPSPVRVHTRRRAVFKPFSTSPPLACNELQSNWLSGYGPSYGRGSVDDDGTPWFHAGQRPSIHRYLSSSMEAMYKAMTV